jgi:hypothetical protein
MSSFSISAMLSMGLLASVAVAANAQTYSYAPAPGQSVASLPPVTGPKTNSGNAIPSAPAPVQAQNQRYPGPAIGVDGGPASTHYQTTPTYETDPVQHPYSTGAQLKAN